MDDGIYGSVFYSLTGLHGLHVIAGLTFIFYALLKLNFEAFNRNPGSHLSFNAAVWY
jgi:cytochrome c oxidase subunit 3